jgi:hypothetical protein
MSQTWRSLVIFGYNKLCSDVCALANMSYEVQTCRMKFTAAKAVLKM